MDEQPTNGFRLFVQRGGLSTLLKALGVMAILDAILFLIAGRVNWPALWLLSALYFLGLAAMVVWGTLRDPGMLAERRAAAKQANVKRWDRLIMGIYTGFLVALLVVPALDARFRWSHMPWWVQALGFLAIVPAVLLIGGATRANTYLSSYVRIQGERGQHVADTGPYRTVRHPMYAGMFFFFPGVALALGSWWGLVPVGIILALMTLRTALEDRTLQAELPGYREYAQRVRYRLIPGIW